MVHAYSVTVGTILQPVDSGRRMVAMPIVVFAETTQEASIYAVDHFSTAYPEESSPKILMSGPMPLDGVIGRSFANNKVYRIVLEEVSPGCEGQI